MNWRARLSALWTRAAPESAKPAVDPRADAVAQVPSEPSGNVLFEQGRAAYLAGNHDAAIQHLNAALDVAHDHGKAHYYLGLAYLGQKRYEDAADCFHMAVHFNAAFPQAIYNLGLDARRRGDFAGASAFFRKAIQLKPDFHQAHNNLGYTLFNDFGEYEEGARHIETALGLRPADSAILCNYSAVLLHRGELDRARAICDQLLSADPDLHEARLNRALVNLKLGRYDTAWVDYEARKRVPGSEVRHDSGSPEWRGEPLHGKSVLVCAEQGLGDQIMFASCLPDLLRACGHGVIECAPRLAELYRRSFPGAGIRAVAAASVIRDDDSARLPCDYQVAIGSLPMFFRKDTASFPAHDGYLRADTDRIAKWQNRLGALGTLPKVGISWRGGAVSTRAALRSVDLKLWLPLLGLKCCRFVSLQYGDTDADLAALARDHQTEVIHWPDAIDTYEDTAALVCALDLVISVQTAVVHLCGALGKPAWVMVPRVAEWRYGETGETIPWYPSVRVLRQSTAGDWSPVMQRLRADVTQRFGGDPC